MPRVNIVDMPVETPSRMSNLLRLLLEAQAAPGARRTVDPLSYPPRLCHLAGLPQMRRGG
jgi:hypothetical protein